MYFVYLISVKKYHDQKKPEEAKALFGLHVHIPVHFLGKPGQELKQEPRGRNQSKDLGATLLTDLLSMVCSACLLYTQEPRALGGKMLTLAYRSV